MRSVNDCIFFPFFLIRGPVCRNMWATKNMAIITKTTTTNTKLPNDTVAFLEPMRN